MRGGGTPAQNRDLAEQTAKALCNEVQGLIRDTLLRQSRPGGLFNPI
jgi:hypothetical protein